MRRSFAKLQISRYLRITTDLLISGFRHASIALSTRKVLQIFKARTLRIVGPSNTGFLCPRDRSIRWANRQHEKWRRETPATKRQNKPYCCAFTEQTHSARARRFRKGLIFLNKERRDVGTTGTAFKLFHVLRQARTSRSHVRMYICTLACVRLMNATAEGRRQ